MHVSTRVLAMGFLVAIGLPALAQQPQYPNRPIRLVIPFPGGIGPVAVSVRVIQTINQALGQPVVADNRPGADGALAAELALKAAPDGHTLFLGTNTAMSALPHLRKSAPFDPVTAFAPVAMIGRYTFFLFVNAGVPVKSVADLIAYARSNPGKLAYASGNSTGQVMMAQMLLVNRLAMVHVPYKGDTLAVSDIASGRVQLMFGSSAIAPMAAEGRVRALAVMLPLRSSLLPDAPPAEEVGLGQVTIRAWGGIFAPAKTPRAIIDRLNHEINAVLQRPESRELFDRGGIAPEPMTPEQLGAHVQDQLDLWGRTMRAAGIDPT